MAAFAILSVALSNPALENNIREAYSEFTHKITENVWLVADKAVTTTSEVCQKIGVGENGLAGVVVLKIDGYFGYASTAIWEWLKVKAGET